MCVYYKVLNAADGHKTSTIPLIRQLLWPAKQQSLKSKDKRTVQKQVDPINTTAHSRMLCVAQFTTRTSFEQHMHIPCQTEKCN